MAVPYKICFLGYKKLGEMARDVISRLGYTDTEILELDCTPETLVQTVDAARAKGCQVFIAGSGNAAEFKRRFFEHLIELHIDLADYLISLKLARERGAKRTAIVVHRQSWKPDMALLEDLSGMKIQLVTYEDAGELATLLENAGCDFVIGASLADEAAGRLGLDSALIYIGEYTIRSGIARARNLAMELRAAARKELVFNAIVRSAPNGIIVTDETGRITVFNPSARNLTGLQETKVWGQSLADVIPTLSYEAFRKTGQAQTDRKHLIGGAMVRCIQTRLTEGSEQAGMLSILQTDNTRRKKADSPRQFVAHHTWKDAVGSSPAARRALAEARTLAEQNEHIMLFGEVGTGKNFFAQCIHNGSPRAQEPYISVNAAAVSRQDAARVLFGSEDASGVRPGLLELAGSGTLALHGLSGAAPAFDAAVAQALTERYFFRVGGVTAVPFQAHLITLLSPEDRDRIPRELRERLGVFGLELPPLRDRPEDILPLFQFLLMEENSLAHHRVQREMAELLRFYSWPANLVTLSAVCKRYALTYRQAVNPSPSARLLLLIHAIGEDELFADILRRHPALRDPSGSPPEAVLAGVESMKRILKYNNSIIADKLGLSRTTLWRMQKNAGMTD